jgi:8-oxo-dGTP diphosphatase
MNITEFVSEGYKTFIPQLSIDCAIFGYHENQLKILLRRWKFVEGWCLPGGYIMHTESVDEAAKRILREDTGLTDVFLQQYYVFGEVDRMDNDKNAQILRDSAFMKDMGNSWLLNRTVSIGYYSLIDYSKADVKPDEFSRDCCWWDITDMPLLLFDHEEMISHALQTIRNQLKYQPVGLNLLPAMFTLPELQILYETILGKKLDRRNFQKKILSLGILRRLNKRRKIGPHRSPLLYAFNKVNYKKALSQSRGTGF